MKTRTLLRLILTGSIMFTLMSDLSAQMTFNEPTNQPVLSYGNPGDWDDGMVWSPTVIKDGDTLRMWYQGSDTIFWEATHAEAGYAWSLDGITWIKDTINNPVLTADYAWEYNAQGPGAVIKDNDTIKIWIDAGGQTGYATSLDGINWNKHPEPVLTFGPTGEWDEWVATATTVIKEGDEYKMWYSGVRPGMPQLEALPQVGYATSPDGINWTKYDDPETENAPYAYSDPVLKVGEVDDWDEHRAFIPLVLKTGCGYEMWYTGLKGPINTDVPEQIGYAVSEDGIVWEKYPGNPVFTDPREWGAGIYGGTILKFDGNYHLWFSCFSSLTTLAAPQIGYAVGLTNEITCLQNGISFNTQSQIDNFKAENRYCAKIGGDVEISGSDITNLDALCNVTEIIGDLEIFNNTGLNNFSGLHNLESIDGDLVVNGNSLINDFSGLNNLKSIDGDLKVFNNSSLNSLSGLDNIAPESIIDMTLAVNSSLSYCAIMNVCEYLAAPNGTITIQENASGCDSQEELYEICWNNVIEHQNFSEVSTHPNPFSKSTSIVYELTKPETVRITFYNQFSKQVDLIEVKQQKGLNKVVWTPENLADGIYYFRLHAGDQMSNGKLLLMK